MKGNSHGKVKTKSVGCRGLWKVTKHEPHRVQLSVQGNSLPSICPSPHLLLFSLMFSVVFSLCQQTLQSLSFYLLYTLAKTLFAQFCLPLSMFRFQSIYYFFQKDFLTLYAILIYSCHSCHVLCTTPSENILLYVLLFMFTVCFSIHHRCFGMISSFLFYSLNIPVLRVTVTY